jgi:hypothetical protein
MTRGFTNSAAPAWSTRFLWETLVEILGDPPEKGPQLVKTVRPSPRLGPVYRGFAATPVRAMELITILSRCHRAEVLSTSKPTSVPTRRASKWPYDRTRVPPQSARVGIWPAPGYDQLKGALSSFSCGVSRLYAMRRISCRRCDLDRFHIVAKMNKTLDEVRAGESRRMASEGRTPLLKKSRGLLLKREQKEEQRFPQRDLLRLT